MRICCVQGCGRKHSCRGYCASHYVTAKRAGEFTKAVCTSAGCGAPVETSGLCHRCYERTRRDSDERVRERERLVSAKYRENNREAILAQKAAYREANKEKIAAAGRRWREQNKAALKERHAKYYKANRDRIVEVAKAYRTSRKHEACRRASAWKRVNRERARANEHRRRSRIVGAGGAYTAAEWAALVNLSGGRCACCGEVSQLTADHIIPVARGGCSNAFNIQPLCISCNSAKKASMIISYLGHPDGIGDPQ